MTKQAKVLTVFNVKGGVSKSTSVKFLSYILSKQGRVLVIDMCSNGNVAGSFSGSKKGNDGHTVYDWVIGESKFKDVVKKVDGEEIYYLPSDDRISRLPQWIDENITFDKDKVLLEKIEPLKQIFTHIILDTHPDKRNFNTAMSLRAAGGSNDLVIVPFYLDGASEDAAWESAKLLSHWKFNYSIVPSGVHHGDFGEDINFLADIVSDFKEDGITNITKNHIRFSRKVQHFSRQNRRSVEKGLAEPLQFTDYMSNKNMKNVIMDYQAIAIELGLLNGEVL